MILAIAIACEQKDIIYQAPVCFSTSQKGSVYCYFGGNVLADTFFQFQVINSNFDDDRELEAWSLVQPRPQSKKLAAKESHV